MPKEAMFTLKLEPELRDSFMAEATAANRPASQIVRDFMREFVKERQEARDHDAWFRAEVEEALREADDTSVVRVPHEQVRSRWQAQRAGMTKRTRG